MPDKVRWGVLSTSQFALKLAVPAMQKSEWCDIRAIASRDRKKAEQAARVAADSGRRLARGAGRFSSALVKPFAHAGGILALEIFGVFFAVFALSFLAHACRLLCGVRLVVSGSRMAGGQGGRLA